MKTFLLGILLPLGLALSAAPVTIVVSAPTYPGQQIVLYRYMDPFTLLKEPIAQGSTDKQGHVTLTAEVDGTQRALLSIGDVGADLFLRAGNYQVKMPAPKPDQARTISGATKVDLTFMDLDHLDVNALASDLNERLDAFLAENLATDADAGMEAVSKARSGKEALVPDTAKGKEQLFLSPQWSETRVDTFATKLKRFYATVEDPWFQSDVEYGIAGLRLGPRTNDRDLFNRYLKDRPVVYNVPEYTRFFTAFFTDHLLRFPFRTDTDALLADIQAARTDSLKALLAKNDFLKDARLNELVLITGLYAQQGNALFDRGGILNVLRDVQKRSVFPEHRMIASNMLWDLTAMTAGTTIPNVELRDTAKGTFPSETWLHGKTFLMVTSLANPYSDQEIAALKKLQAEYGAYVNFVNIALDRSPEELARWLRVNPGTAGTWATPTDQRTLLDQWRIRSVPAFFLLDGNVLTASPGPRPSLELPAVLHRIKVEGDRDGRIKPDRGVPPPKR